MAGGQRLRGKGDRAVPQDDVRPLFQSLYVLNTILYVFTVVLGRVLKVSEMGKNSSPNVFRVYL